MLEHQFQELLEAIRSARGSAPTPEEQEVWDRKYLLGFSQEQKAWNRMQERFKEQGKAVIRDDVPFEHSPITDVPVLTEQEWDKLFLEDEDAFWRLVRAEAESEPDRVAYYAEVDRAERFRIEKERRARAALLPPPRPGTLTLDEALSKLEAVRSAGPGKWRSRCPVHQGDGDSLLITELHVRPGTPYFHCFVGCDWRAVLDALKAA